MHTYIHAHKFIHTYIYIPDPVSVLGALCLAVSHLVDEAVVDVPVVFSAEEVGHDHHVIVSQRPSVVDLHVPGPHDHAQVYTYTYTLTTVRNTDKCV